VGYYYVTASDLFSSKESGLKLRAELQYRWVTAGVEWRDDDRALGGNWLGTVRVSVPLGRGTSGDETDHRLTAPIRSDDWPSTFDRTKEIRRAQAVPRRRTWSPPVQEKPAEDCCGGAPPVIIYD
jgi:hypothetical protein